VSRDDDDAAVVTVVDTAVDASGADALGADTSGPDTSGPDTSGPDGPPRGVLIAAVALAVVALIAVLAVAASHRTPPRPVAIAAVPAPQADGPECRALMADLPDRLGELGRAAAMDPIPAGTAAWGSAEEPVIMRCGLDRPAEFVVGSPLQMVDDVQWFRLDDPDTRRSTWIAVDRPAYVALTLPLGSGPTPIQVLSTAIAGSMPETPIRPGPAR
jgi:hypothetical protein